MNLLHLRPGDVVTVMFLTGTRPGAVEEAWVVWAGSRIVSLALGTQSMALVGHHEDDDEPFTSSWGETFVILRGESDALPG